MKIKITFIQLITIILVFLGCKKNEISTINKDLIVINQNYNEALKIASKQNKLIFIDFYTTWCGPCKKLDKLIFQNDSIQQILKKDFILLKYNAENDTVFHLSKKHHISSYPTAIILNKNGFVLNRKYGFPGDDFKSLSKNVLAHTKKSILLNKKNKTIKGYSNKIDSHKYPKFYVDYINRTNTKVNKNELNKYLTTKNDVFSEEYFSTLLYFAGDVSNKVANKTLKNREKYLDLYGKTDVDILMYFLISGKFKVAISEINQLKFNQAVVYAKKGLDDKKWVNFIISNSEKAFLKALKK